MDSVQLQSLEDTLGVSNPLDSNLWVYAILDCAKDSQIYPAVKASFARYQNLFMGITDEVLIAASPHLVRLRRDQPFTQWLIEHGWGNSWGIFFQSDRDFPEMYRHLRRFLRVKSEDDKKFLFRFYDPRVFRYYLPTCNADELEYVFGAISTFHMEDVFPEHCLRFQRDEQGNLLQETISFSDTSSLEN